MKMIKLNTGYEIPILGEGTWKIEQDEVRDAIRNAIKIGYRHFDCAAAYGNEKQIGEALLEAIKEGDVFRSELFITSKLWNDSHAADDVEKALKKTLSDLQLEYLDLYLIHWPVATKKVTGEKLTDDDFIPLEKLPISETWKEMERLKGMGYIRSIGVSNFGIQRLEEMKNYASVMPAVNQVESHPYLAQNELIDYARDNDIAITAYAPLATRHLSGSEEESPIPLLTHPLIKEIAIKHNASPAQILIVWQIERDIIVIPKSIKPERLKENYDAQFIQLDSHDMHEIAKINRDYRYIPSTFFESGINGYTQESIWR